MLVVKLARVGGPSAAGEIAEAAAEHGVRVVVSTLFETGVGIAGALNFAARLPEIDHGLATAGLFGHDLLVEPLSVTRGRVRVPGSSGSGGLGIVLDARALERFSVETIGRPA